MKRITPSLVLALLAAAGFTCRLPAGSASVTDCSPVPESLRAALKLAPFYEQCVLVGDFPILASGKVSPVALREAGAIIAAMMEQRPEVLAAIAGQKVRLAVMAHDEFTTDVPEHGKLEPREYWDRRARGLGASPETLTVSCGEENLTCLRGDPYAAENILVHEFGHVVHEFGMKAVDPAFDDRLNKTYQDAMKRGLWHGKYAASNRMEYWAEGVQSWFDTNRHDDFEHNHVHTRAQIREYDPALAALLESVFGDRAWRYARPAERTPPPAHFAGFDAARAPEFHWPQRLLAWQAEFKKGNVTLAPRSATRVDLAAEGSRESWKSAGGGAKSKLYVLNVSPEPVVLDWVDFEGRPRRHAILRNGDHFETDTFVGHNWRVTPEAGDAPPRFFTAGEGVSDVVVK
jgi:hypothetical protein